MQQLTYINLRGERAVFGRGAPYLLRSVRGVGACGNALTLTEDGARDGGRLLSLRREAREITAVIQILGATRQGLYESREALCRVLSPDLAADGESRARLVYENDHGAWWTWAVPLGGLDWTARAGDVHTGVNVRFQCESPFLYGSEPREAVFRQTSGGFRLPGRLPVRLGSQVFQMRVTNGGSAFAPCVVTVEGSGENAFGYLDPLSSVAAFGLRPGENNIEYVPTGDRSRSVIRVRWYDTFEGV